MQETLAHESTQTRAAPRVRWQWLAIAVVVAGALAVRAWTLRGGLPYVDHPDEPNPINYVVEMLRTGDPNPHAFQKPSLYIYLLLAVLTVHYRLGLASGLYAGLDQMTVTTHLYTTIPGFFLWGRMLTATIAALTVAWTYAIGRRTWSSSAGLIAALFLALSPFHMRHSQYVTTDVASGWLVLLAFGAAVAVAQTGRWRDYLAAGAFAGLAAATKYNAGVAALMVVAAHLVYSAGDGEERRTKNEERRTKNKEQSQRTQNQEPGTTEPKSEEQRTTNKEQSHRNGNHKPGAREPPEQSHRTGNHSLFLALLRLPRLIGAGAAALLAFVAGTPYALLSWDEFRRGILGQVEDYGGITHGDFTDPWNWRGYLGFFMGDGLGRIACVALLAGLGLLLWRRRAAGLIWLSFVIPYLLLHMAQASHFTRNMLPVVVLSALPIGVAGAALIARLAESRGTVEPGNQGTVEQRTKNKEQNGREPGNQGTREPESRQATTGHRRETGERQAALRITQPPTRSTQQRRQFSILLSSFFILIVLLALLLPNALGTLGYSARLSRGDTRVQALEWIETHVPPGVRVAAELRPLPGPLESRWAEAPGLLRHDLPWYRAQGYAYLIASSDAWQQWAIPEEYQRFAGHPPLVEFGGASPRDMLGPHLAVYATGLAPGDAPERPAGVVQMGGAQLVGLAIGRPDPKAPQLGLDAAHEFKPGEILGLRTFWSVAQPFEQDYFVFVHMLDAAGTTVTQRDTPPWQGRFPTSSWQAGTLVVDVNDLALPAGLAPGEYTLAIGMFDPASGTHPPMTLDGQALDRVPVARIRVVK